jgi:ribonuclease VapC
LDEPGNETVVELIEHGSLMSAVNVAEVTARMLTEGLSQAEIEVAIVDLKVRALPFEASHAFLSGLLRESTRHLGLSLGDRCCLATAIELGTPVLTADRAWSQLPDLGVSIELCR